MDCRALKGRPRPPSQRCRRYWRARTRPAFLFHSSIFCCSVALPESLSSVSVVEPAFKRACAELLRYCAGGLLLVPTFSGYSLRRRPKIACQRSTSSSWSRSALSATDYRGLSGRNTSNSGCASCFEKSRMSDPGHRVTSVSRPTTSGLPLKWTSSGPAAVLKVPF